MDTRTDANWVLKSLVNWTVRNSGHVDKRLYIGLSQIGECEREIYDQVRTGRKMTLEEHLRTRVTNELEAAVIERLKAIKLYGEPEAINLFNGLVQGHTDGRIGEAVLEIKTVSYDGHFPQSRLPERVYWQVQAYLHYLQRREAVVLYMARANGEFRCYPVRSNYRIGLLIEEKVKRVVRAVLNCERPMCTCGHCEAEA